MADAAAPVRERPSHAWRSIADRVADLRRPRAAARLARLLWIVWAVIVWNVVLDHVIVRAGRDYLLAAARADAAHAARPNMDAFMRPAVTRGLLTGSASGGLILLIGLASVRAASRAASHR
jgi:divalent metal cation (Fe/Co/Zn/Cd) transporter